MNVIIPMAGLGTRFPKDQYPYKPLIDINGKPMIIRAIESLGIKGNYYFAIRKNEHLDYVKEIIYNTLPSAAFIEIDYVTEGPACTVLLFKEYINNKEELVVANCDQIMEWNADLFLYNARLYDGCVVTYHSDTDKNSYVKLSNKGQALEFKEKIVISNIGLNGIHYWQQGSFFVDSAEDMIAANNRAPNNEFYVAPTYNYMIKRGLNVGIFHIPNQQHNPVGVPEDLEKYLSK
jgi:NDP-sugar pyrophosphorylase family protein